MHSAKWLAFLVLCNIVIHILVARFERVAREPHYSFNSHSLEHWSPCPPFEIFDSFRSKSAYYRPQMNIIDGITQRFAAVLKIRPRRVVLQPSSTSGRRSEHILVLGGSMTGGAECTEQDFGHFKECAWPARFQIWLNRTFDHFQVTNLARGGTQTEVALSSLTQLISSFQKQIGKKPQLIITDFSVNDVYELSGNVGRTSSMHYPNFTEYDKAVAVAETLITLIRGQGIEHWIILSHHPKSVSSILNAYADVATFHKVPLLDLRPLWPQFWEPNSAHPDYRAHQLIAEILAKSFIRGYFRCNQTDYIADPLLTSTLAVCTVPVTAHSAYDKMAQSEINRDYHGPWKLIQDRPGKPGWISSVHGSNITFSVRFGPTPTLLVNYLRSYEGLGDAVLSLNNAQVILRGTWSRQVSSTSTFYSQAYANTVQTNDASDDNHYGIIGFSVKPYSDHELTLSFNDCKQDCTVSVATAKRKFKLIEIITC